MKNINLYLTLGLATLILTNSQAQNASSVENKTTHVYSRVDKIENADMALKLLVDGNKRFIADSTLQDDISLNKKKMLKEKGQNPIAVIVTCSDSRVPPELIFDQGLGDLFVIRVAGNVIDSIEMGSIQYAVEHLKTPLVLVLGHQKCGAVQATIDGGEIPGSIPSICSRISPSVLKVKSASGTSGNFSELVIEANVDASVTILENDPMIKHLVEHSGLKVLGAKYMLDSGSVNFLN